MLVKKWILSMEHPPLWLILLGSSFFAWLTRAKAVKHQRNPKKWFLMGFIFGIWGLIAFYLTKKIAPLSAPAASNPKPLDLFNLQPGAWYYEDSQTVVGPISPEYLKSLFDKGQISLNTLIWHENLENWEKLEQFRQ